MNPRQPVLIAAHQLAYDTPSAQRTPIDALAEVSKATLAQVPALKPQALDCVAVVEPLCACMNLGVPGITYDNVPASLGKRLGAQHAAWLQTTTGGDSPQRLINYLAARMLGGEQHCALISGAELLNTMAKTLGGKGPLKTAAMVARYLLTRRTPLHTWHESIGSSPHMLGDTRPGTSRFEYRHGLYPPSSTYPLFENALRGQLGNTLEQHTKMLGQLMAPLAQVAASHPLARYPQGPTAQQISATSTDNRMVGLPYTKWMNARPAVDMAAAVVMCTVERAQALGVPPDQMVFLNGFAGAHDQWHVTDRRNLAASPAIHEAGRAALRMSGLKLEEINAFDLYSCFPSAVQIARNELGISPQDPRPLSLTGGLAYFGGPGNNYSLHAVVQAVHELRERRYKHVMVTANGWYLTKHALGIYSTHPGVGEPMNAQNIQQRVDARPARRLDEQATGTGTVETYTVVHDRRGAISAIVLGELAGGERFLANVPGSRGALAALARQDLLGARGTVVTRFGRCRFYPH